MAYSLWLLLGLMFLSYLLAFGVIFRKSRDLRCKIFSGAMIFSVFASYLLIIYHFFLSPGTVSIDIFMVVSIVLLTIALLLPEFSKFSARSSISRRLERRYYDPSVVDFLILYTFNWINVFMFVSIPHSIALNGSSIAQYIIKHPLRLLTISFVWLLGGNVPAEEFPIDYPYIGPGLIVFIVNTLILIATYFNAWLDKVMLRLKHHRLKDKPIGLRLREHAVIWGDSKLIKEIVREYVAKDEILPRDIVLVSKRMRDIQFISAAGSIVYPRLWAIDGSLGDPDTLLLADMGYAHEFGIIDAMSGNPKEETGNQSAGKPESRKSKEEPLTEKIRYQDIISAVSEISVRNYKAQICAVVRTDKDRWDLDRIRKIFRKELSEKERAEDDFIMSAQEIKAALRRFADSTPGIIDVLYDIFSYRNLGGVDSNTNINILPLSKPKNADEPFIRGTIIYFPIKVKNTGDSNDDKTQWFMITGFKRHLGEGDAGKIFECETVGRSFTTGYGNLKAYKLEFKGDKCPQFHQIISSPCAGMDELADVVNAIASLRRDENNEQKDGIRKRDDGSSDSNIRNGVIYLRTEVESFLLGETILRNFRRRIAQVKTRKDEKDDSFWHSIILDIVDVPLFSSVLVARCLLTDKGNRLFKFMKDYKGNPFILFYANGRVSIEEVFKRCKEREAVPIYARKIRTGDGDGNNSAKPGVLIYAMKYKQKER